jgi:segregation and condensation protein A
VILYLIRRDNLDIYDIPIAKITREYLDYLNMMEDMRIEVAGEFFVLAATLMRIKVQMLLRRDDDESEDPRQELVRSLLEYKKMVEAAKTFRELEEHQRHVFTRPVPQSEKDPAGEAVVDLSLFQLMRAFQELMTQIEGAEVGEVELEKYTIEEKIDLLRGSLEDREPLMFADLFGETRSRLEVIVTFMALLELLKHGQARVQQDASFGTRWIYRGANFGSPMAALTDWSADAEGPSEVPVPEHGTHAADADEKAEEVDGESESR